MCEQKKKNISSDVAEVEVLSEPEFKEQTDNDTSVSRGVVIVVQKFLYLTTYIWNAKTEH